MSLEIKDKLLTSSPGASSEGRVPRWYFGGVASALAVSITHPLDTMKVYYQTPGSLASGNKHLISSTMTVIRTNGALALYNGLTASLLRQLTYSTTRFAVYELLKQKLATTNSADNYSLPPLHTRMMIASLSGALGGLVGAPADVVNVRMQNDIKLPPLLKRNYRNAFNGFHNIIKKEGVSALFQGSSMSVARSVLISIGQLAMYDQFKYLLSSKLELDGDAISTHIISSIFTSITCTMLTQPLDVLKTRMMNAPKSHRQSIQVAVIDVFYSAGLCGFYKGFMPSMIRLFPQTILVLVFYEQLRLKYGLLRTSCDVDESLQG